MTSAYALPRAVVARENGRTLFNRCYQVGDIYCDCILQLQGVVTMSVVDVEGQRIRYSVAGQGPVIMVQPPGWGSGCGLYEETFKQLERDFTVVYHDTRGSGGSLPVADPSSVNVRHFVADLEALRDHLKIPSFALVGHSHGGFIAMNYALQYPRHLRCLILVDAQLGVDEPGQDVQRILPKLARDPRYAAAVAVFSGPWQLDTDENFKALVDGVWPLYFANPDGEAAARSRALLRAGTINSMAMRQTTATNSQFLVRDRLKAIEAETLVLVGRHDFICSPVQAQLIHDGIHRSRLVEFENSGHLPWLEEPDAFFSTVKRFVAG